MYGYETEYDLLISWLFNISVFIEETHCSNGANITKISRRRYGLRRTPKPEHYGKRVLNT